MAGNFKSTMLFDVLKNILTTKSYELYEKHVIDPNFKDAAGFMIRRYLSMHPQEKIRDAVLSNYSSLERMDKKTLYLYLLSKIPRTTMTFIKYLR